jgi:hypothetical protein
LYVSNGALHGGLGIEIVDIPTTVNERPALFFGVVIVIDAASVTVSPRSILPGLGRH